MILRAIQDPAPAQATAVAGVWDCVEQEQKRLTGAKECWMVPQPAHSALAGEMAAQLDPKVFPDMTPEVIRAIAMHDSGWGTPDAMAIQDSRAKSQSRPAQSFLTVAPDVIFRAWIDSIGNAEKLSAVGGYMVSRHFYAIGKANATAAKDPKSAKMLEAFFSSEEKRQQKLASKVKFSQKQLDRCVEALQFCDLLSLYVCANPPEAMVEFPQEVKGSRLKLWRERNICVLEPSPFAQESTYGVAAIRHPKTKDVTSASFAVMVR